MPCGGPREDLECFMRQTWLLSNISLSDDGVIGLRWLLLYEQVKKESQSLPVGERLRDDQRQTLPLVAPRRGHQRPPRRLSRQAIEPPLRLATRVAEPRALRRCHGTGLRGSACRAPRLDQGSFTRLGRLHVRRLTPLRAEARSLGAGAKDRGHLQATAPRHLDPRKHRCPLGSRSPDVFLLARRSKDPSSALSSYAVRRRFVRMRMTRVESSQPCTVARSDGGCGTD